MRKLLCMFLCLTMIFSLFPVSVFAEDGNVETESVEEADMLIESTQEDTCEDDMSLAESAPIESEESVGSIPEEADSEPDSEAEEEVPPEDKEEPQLETEDEAPDETEFPEEEESLEEEQEESLELLPVQVRFLITPADAVLIVYAKNELGEKVELQPEEDGSWLLLPGEYYYTATADGYEPLVETVFVLTNDAVYIELPVTLIPLEDAAPVSIMSTSGTCGDNLTWTLDDDGVLTISGTGAMANYSYYTGNAPWGYSVRAVVIVQGVTSIGNWAFSYCRSLTSVTIPDSVTSIGDSAFSDCSSLTSVTIPDSVTIIGNSAFSGCSSLTSVTIPDSVTIIRNIAFSGCSSLTSIDIPNSVTYIGYQAFYNCSGLSRVIIHDIAAWCKIEFKIESGYNANPLAYGGSLFIGEKEVSNLAIPDSVTSIGRGAFSGCSSLTNVTIPDSVTSIGDSAFSGCSSLTSVTIPDSVTRIGDSAFSGCSSLTSVTIPDSVTRIDEEAFENCSSLTSVTIPDSVTSIGDRAFYGCSSLTSVEIPDSVTYIGRSAFSHCSSLTSVTIPDSVTRIDEEAFYGCKGLADIDGFVIIRGVLYNYYGNDTTVKVPNNVTSIGEYAFYGCSSLTSVTIGNSVTSIGEYAFENCSSLTSVTIPDSVTSIGPYAFYGCSSLTNITIPIVNGHFGYMFGADFPSENSDYVPSSIKVVTIIGGNKISSKYFYNCSSLTSVTIPDSVTSIGSYAFYGCSSLTSVTIPDSVTSIGDRAFYGCSSLTSVTIPDSVTSIGSYAFYGCSSLTSVSIPASVTSIGDAAFYGCSSLTSVGNLGNVTSIGSCAFENCSRLTNVGSLGSVTSIGWNAFSGCSSLTSVVIPDSVTSIEYQAFYNCSSLTSVGNLGNVTSIGYQAFYNCSSLTNVGSLGSVTSIGYQAFYNCSSLTNVGSLGSVTSIGWNAFYNCSSLTNVGSLGNVTSIGSSAFYMCSNMTGSITLLEGVTKIPREAFYNCAKLESVAIPKTVTEIEKDAFYGCSGLKTVYYSGTIQRWNTINVQYGNDVLLDVQLITDYHIHQIELRNEKDATCTEDGYTGDRVCVLCNEVVEKGTVIPKHHTPELRNAKKATIYEDGYTGDEVCRVCGQTVSTGKVIPKIAIQNGGTVLTDSGTAVRLDASSVGRSLSWTITEGSAFASVNNSGVLTPKAVTAEARVTVVAAKTDLQDGKEFSVVIEPAGLESLMIPTDVDRVAPGAFAGSESLKAVQIPDTVTEIGDGAFADCPKLSVYANPGTAGEQFALAHGIPVVEYPDGRFALETEYLLLKVGQSAQMNFRNGKEDWKDITEWSSSNPGTASVDRKGQVKALKAGMAYIRAAINEGGTVYTAECRIDVLDEKKQGGTPIEASLPITKITTELLKTDYARIPVILTLKQNSMNPADVKLSDGTVLEDTGVMIEEAIFIGGGKADIRTAFGLRVADDRNLELVPIINVKDPAAVKAVAGSYKSAIHLKLSNDTEFDTAEITVTVKKSQPKLTAKPVTVNSFITGQTVPVEITGGRVSSVKKQDLGFATLNSDLTVTVKDGNTKNASKTVTLSVQPDDWAVATTLKITVKNQYKAPKVVLKPSSVTVNRSLGDTAAAAVAVTPLEGMNHTISASGVSGLTAWYDDSTESVMVSAGTAAAGKTAYKVPVKADGKAVAYLSVKVVDTSASITAKISGTINPSVKNSPAVITVTGKNYNAASGTYTVKIRQNGKDVSSGLFRTSQNGNIISITVGEKFPADGKYTATVSCEIGSAKEVSFTVKTSKAPAMTASLKAEGSIDILRGTGRILVTPTIKNRYDYDKNKLGLNLPDGLTWEYKNGKFIVTAIPGANINPAVKTATLTLDGKTISKAVTLTLKQGKVTVTQSTKEVTLSKQDRYDRQSVILSLSDSTLQGIRDVTLTGGNGVLKLIPLGNGEYAIGYTNSKLPADIAKLKSTTVKLNVFLQGNGGAKADATLSVKVTFA